MGCPLGLDVFATEPIPAEDPILKARGSGKVAVGGMVVGDSRFTKSSIMSSGWAGSCLISKKNIQESNLPGPGAFLISNIFSIFQVPPDQAVMIPHVACAR